MDIILNKMKDQLDHWQTARSDFEYMRKDKLIIDELDIKIELLEFWIKEIENSQL